MSKKKNVHYLLVDRCKSLSFTFPGEPSWIPRTTKPCKSDHPQTRISKEHSSLIRLNSSDDNDKTFSHHGADPELKHWLSRAYQVCV